MPKRRIVGPWVPAGLQCHCQVPTQRHNTPSHCRPKEQRIELGLGENTLLALAERLHEKHVPEYVVARPHVVE